VTQEEEDALERQNTSPLVRTRKGDSSLVKQGKSHVVILSTVVPSPPRAVVALRSSPQQP
jgi:hypothetical protein